MRATTCGVSAPADSTDKGYFRSFRTIHSSHMLREGARPEVVRDILGHANIDVTQNVYGWLALGYAYRFTLIHLHSQSGTDAISGIATIFFFIRL